MKKIMRTAGILLAIVAVLAVYCHLENTMIQTTELSVESDQIPAEFDGYRIVQVSDLHNAVFGEGNETLLEKIRESKPDCIFITGDLIDARRTDLAVAEEFVRKAVDIAPVFYVTGNHEAVVDQYGSLKRKMKQMGVQVLDNTVTELEKDGAKINLLGFADPRFFNPFKINPSVIFDKALSKMEVNHDTYTILLSHRPEMLSYYSQNQMDLVFSGHAHGGQFRLPVIGGVFAPNQGLFPKYTAGIYEEGTTRMVVSRGLGNSSFPFRINNNPELVVVTLQAG